jgi:hypothetical protein
VQDVPDAKVGVDFELGGVVAKRARDGDEECGLVLDLDDAAGPRQESDELVDAGRISQLDSQRPQLFVFAPTPEGASVSA